MVRIIDAFKGALGLGRSPRAHRKNVVKANATLKGAGRDEQGRSKVIAHGLYRKMMNRSPRTEERMTSADRARALYEKNGQNKAAAAREAGMSSRSFDRALKGSKVRSQNAEKLARAERKNALNTKTADRLAGSMTGVDRKASNDDANGTLGLWVRIAFSGKSEDRWIYPGGRPENQGSFDDLRELMENEGIDGLNERTHEIMDNYLPDHDDVEVEEIVDIQW